jgi:hypothetical protein
METLSLSEAKIKGLLLILSESVSAMGEAKRRKYNVGIDGITAIALIL